MPQNDSAADFYVSVSAEHALTDIKQIKMEMPKEDLYLKSKLICVKQWKEDLITVCANLLVPVGNI